MTCDQLRSAPGHALVEAPVQVAVAPLQSPLLLQLPGEEEEFLAELIRLRAERHVLQCGVQSVLSGFTLSVRYAISATNYATNSAVNNAVTV